MGSDLETSYFKVNIILSLDSRSDPRYLGHKDVINNTMAVLGAEKAAVTTVPVTSGLSGRAILDPGSGRFLVFDNVIGYIFRFKLARYSILATIS